MEDYKSEGFIDVEIPGMRVSNVEESIDQIIEFLKQDKVKNVSILNFINSYEVISAKRVGQTVMLRGRSDVDWVYISSGDPEELGTVIKEFTDGDRCFAIIEDWMMPYIRRGKGIKWILSCIKLVLDDGVQVSQPENEVSPLKVEDAEYIYRESTYSEFTPVEYIKDRIMNGISAGIYKDNKLAAWAITHDDGAIGFLHVLQEYRGQGFAKDITKYMAFQLRKRKMVPFVCIEEDNEKSMLLAEKMGFKQVGKVHWFELE